MQKTILITGATDGIGLETARMLVSQGHQVLLHGRNHKKLMAVETELINAGGAVESYLADLSDFEDVRVLAKEVRSRHSTIDVLLNNAGVLKVGNTITGDGFDVRFVVNTFAPYLLTQLLLPVMNTASRVINVSSAAQAPVNPDALSGKMVLSEDLAAYAQSKLALTMWSAHMAQSLKDNGPVVIAVNPGSLLASKMVQEGFGVAGSDIGKGARILAALSVDDAYSDASGRYFDNDSGKFAAPHQDALDSDKNAELVRLMDSLLTEISES